MSDTTKATEARQANAVARREENDEARKRTAAELTIIKRYGEFLPENTVDPVGVFNLWKKSIFGDEPADDTIMYFIVAQAKAAGIDVRIPKQIYAIPFNHKYGDRPEAAGDGARHLRRAVRRVGRRCEGRMSGVARARRRAYHARSDAGVGRRLNLPGVRCVYSDTRIHSITAEHRRSAWRRRK